MEKRVLYPRQANACLPIFYFLRAERATRQRRPLLQQVMCRSKLPAHRWKRSLQLGAFIGDEKESTLPTANKCLFANLLLFASGEGDEATSPSFTTSYASIQASSASLEMPISAWYLQWGWKSEYFTHGKQMPICQSFTFCERRGRRGNVALFYNKLRVDPSFQPITGNAHFSLVRSVKMEKRVLYTTANKCLFADLLLFTSGEGDEATSPSFTASYVSIRASSPSMETLILALYVQWGCKCEHVTHGKQMPICQSFTFGERRGRRGNVALFYNKLRADPSFQRIDGNGHFSLVRSMAMQMRTFYPRQANTYLPIFYFLRAGRAIRRCHPLLQLKMWGLMLPACCWKHSLQHSKCSGDENGRGIPTANKYLFADLFLFTSREGEEAPSPSFATSYEPIQAFNGSLEMVISAWCVQWGCKCEQFPHGKQIPVCRSFPF